MHDDLDRARAESAELLGLNPDKLTPAGALKCELVSALRSVVDDELGKVDRANAADLSRLIVAVEALTKFLKESPADERSEDDEDGDPHERLMRIIDNWIAAEEAERAERGLSGLMPDLSSAQARIDELEAELAALRNALPAPDGAERSALPAPAPERTITPSISDIVPPGEQSDRNFRIGVQRTPDDLKAMRPKPTIDGEAVPPAPTAAEREAKRQAINNDRSAYQQQGLRPVGGEPWRPFVGGGNEGFFWGGSTGTRAW
jgi:hypothetical protein